jgi:hypothetical protein
MTLGIAVATWVDADEPSVLIAADTRLMSGQETLSDAGIKTFDLGGRAAMVVAGQALPALTAAEIVRPLIETHNRIAPTQKIGFGDTCRLTSFFLKRSAEQIGASCKAVIAGFLTSGLPMIAHIWISPGKNHAAFFECSRGDFIALPVGADDGVRLLVGGLEAAKREGKPSVNSVVGLLWYMITHPGTFPKIGGAISVGTCVRDSYGFSWPFIEIEGRRFLRGVDVTDSYRTNWPYPLKFTYDESWCSRIDQEVATCFDAQSLVVGKYNRYDIDSWFVDPDKLFQQHDDPPGFEHGIPRK